MPTVIIKGTAKDGKPFSHETGGGCFAFLGRYDSTKDALFLHLDKKAGVKTGIKSLDTLVYLESRDRSDAMLERLMVFPFMRTMLEPKKQEPLEFNIKDYTLNEVMHALFWVRGCALGNSDSLEVMGKSHLPSWLCFLLSSTYYKQFNTMYTDSYTYGSMVGGDGTLLDFTNGTNLVSLAKFLTNPPERKYEGGTFLEELTEHSDRGYIQNISDYSLSHLTRGPNPYINVPMFLKDLLRSTYVEPKKPNRNVSTLGFKLPNKKVIQTDKSVEQLVKMYDTDVTKKLNRFGFKDHPELLTRGK